MTLIPQYIKTTQQTILLEHAATLTITIPDALVSDVLDAFDYAYVRPEETTKALWARQMVLEFIINTYKKYKRDSLIAAQAAIDAQSAIDTQNVTVE